MEDSVSSMRGIDICIWGGVLHCYALDAAEGLVPNAPGTGGCPGANGAR